MKRYYFYSRVDNSQEPVAYTTSLSRCRAAKHFAQMKQMSLKSFLTIFAVSR